MTTQGLTYAKAGVSIQAGDKLVHRIGPIAGKTRIPGVIAGVGGFSALFDLQSLGYRHPILVSSTDGVGTKLKIAFMTGIHDTIGIDLVAMGVNDVLTQGAAPLFFLDYFVCGNLDVDIAEAVVRGVAAGCRQAGCALIGGETAQMPGMYQRGEYDLAGCIVGVVDRGEIINGSRVRVGDVVLGLSSNGLHTNGYSLARKILFERLKLKLSSRIPGVRGTLGEELLRVHRNYQPLLAKVPRGMIHGLAHITGGGLIDNLPRILSNNCDAAIDTRSWRVPEIFNFIGRKGNVDRTEVYQVFNMGIGMVAIVNQRDVAAAKQMLRAKVIGRIERGTGKTKLL